MMTTSLNEIQTIIMKYYIPIVYVVGATNNILNIILFSRRKLRLNCCSWYFIFLSLSQFLLLDINCLLRIITTWLNYNGFSTINSLCKIRSYLNVLTLVLTRHFICLISIDRWLITSTNIYLRNKSSLKNVRWIIFSSFLFWIIFSIHAAIGYSSSCSPSPDSDYAVFSAIYNITTSSTPFFIVIIFSILTMINIRKSTQQINQIRLIALTRLPVISMRLKKNIRLIRKRRDMDFVRLAIFQTIPYLLFNIISSFSPIFLYLNSISPYHTDEKTTQLNFIHSIGTCLLYLYISITFIFYILASNIFRKEFLLLCRQCFRCTC